jgi:hypothetical protein
MSGQPSRTVHSALLWTGRVLSALPALLLLFSAAMKFRQPPELIEGLGRLGWPTSLAAPLGVVELIATLLYIVPQTSVLGAILLTSYLGGAIATHVRIADPFLLQAAVGVVIWLGLYLREPRLWPLLPWRRPGGN